MTDEQYRLLDRPISQIDYFQEKDDCLKSHELDAGERYRLRLLLAERYRNMRGIGVYALDSLVEISFVNIEARRPFAVIRYVIDGKPQDRPYTPSVSQEGIVNGSAAPLPVKEGYFSDANGYSPGGMGRVDERLALPISTL